MRAGLFLALTGATALFAEDGAAKDFPVSKIVKLLTDMKDQLEEEGREDEKVFKKLECWVERNTKHKNIDVDEYQSKLRSLEAKIEELTGAVASYETEIEQLEKEVAANVEGLKQQGELRKKERATFNADEKELMESITALGAALEVLSKHHPSEIQVMDAQNLISQQFRLHKDILGDVPELPSRITEFVQQPVMNGDYNSQSGEVFGILRQMKETFEANLAQARKDEEAAQQTFSELQAAKESELDGGREHLKNKREALATAKMDLALASQEKKDVQAALTTDQAFIMEVEKKWVELQAQYNERVKMRGEETSAIAEAIQILSADEATSTFHNTLSLIQTHRTIDSPRRTAAAQVLRDAAAKWHKPGLAMIAQSVRLDAFEKVQEAINGMIAELKQQQADEVVHRDQCVSDSFHLEKELQRLTHEQEAEEASIGVLEGEIANLLEEIKTGEDKVEDTKKQIQEAGEHRASENLEFQDGIKQQSAAARLLQKAIKVLERVYARRQQETAATGGGGFIQVDLSTLQDPEEEKDPKKMPETFKEYRRQAGGGALGMLQQVLGETKKMIAELKTAETAAQTTYEDFVREANASITALTEEITNNKQTEASKRGEHLSTKEQLASTNLSIEAAKNEMQHLKGECDFVVKNFDVRQQARTEEIEALQQAKAILKGAMVTGENFLQKTRRH